KGKIPKRTKRIGRARFWPCVRGPRFPNSRYTWDRSVAMAPAVSLVVAEKSGYTPPIRFVLIVTYTGSSYSFQTSWMAHRFLCVRQSLPHRKVPGLFQSSRKTNRTRCDTQCCKRVCLRRCRFLGSWRNQRAQPASTANRTIVLFPSVTAHAYHQ